ncbi:MAG: glycosyltransferase family 4 protein [Alphaproteobacteria bacterium]|nr:glycosyltransferase family 4 protein [Alphaproteobacteria bacterium]
MKIAIVTGIFPPDHGGPASYVPQIAAAFAARGERIVSVTTLSNSLSHDDALHPFRMIRIRRDQNKLLRMIKTVFIIRREAQKADVIYLNGLVLEGIIATKIISRRPVVIKVVGDLIWERAQNQGATRLDIKAFQNARLPLKWNLLRRLQGWYTGMADAVITPSDFLADIVGGWGISKNLVHTIYNAVELPPPASAPVQYDLISVARFVPWKGLLPLIEIASEKGLTLHLVGDGPLRAALENKAKSIGARVSFAGYVAKHRVVDEIRAARIFVLNSDYEGLPHIVLEAMAAGTPVIATAAGGTPETITHGVDGLLVPPCDKTALAAAIDKLLADENLRRALVQNGRDKIATRFMFDKMIGQTLDLLRKAAA